MKKNTKLLVHCCCGPCASGSIDRLIEEGFLPVLYYGNSNIYPEKEHLKRLNELKKVATFYNLEVIQSTYDHKKWLENVKGHENDEEKGERCSICFNYNLNESYEVAKKLDIDFFTTTLTISPYKSSMEIFRIGQDYNGFVSIDLKKKDGYKKSITKSKELNLYRQQYCGCEFSLKSLLQRQSNS